MPRVQRPKPLEQAYQELMSIQDPNELKQAVIRVLRSMVGGRLSQDNFSRIQHTMKQMGNDLSELQKYVTNLMLIQTGHGVVSPREGITHVLGVINDEIQALASFVGDYSDDSFHLGLTEAESSIVETARRRGIIVGLIPVEKEGMDPRDIARYVSEDPDMPFDAIDAEPEEAYYYAQNVIKGRWPEAEPTIMTDPEWAYRYALNIIKGRWPEAEPIIMKSPIWANKYRREVIKSARYVSEDPDMPFDAIDAEPEVPDMGGGEMPPELGNDMIDEPVGEPSEVISMDKALLGMLINYAVELGDEEDSEARSEALIDAVAQHATEEEAEGEPTGRVMSGEEDFEEIMNIMGERDDEIKDEPTGEPEDDGESEDEVPEDEEEAEDGPPFEALRRFKRIV